MNVIKGKTLRDALISGANNVTNQRQQVDALNVFPVPDGDTGTNMSMTISAAKRELELTPDNARVDEVAQTAASALLRGARGNAGGILFLLFRGFSKGLAGKKSATASDIAGALAMGVDAAYKAVMKPTEGTILTVSRMAAEKAREAVESAPEDMVGMWNQAVVAAAETLEKTPDLLPVLKKAGVVDAGGKGYLAVLEGMRATFVDGVIIPLAEDGGQQAPKSRPTPAEEDPFDPDYDEDMTFTYCTEFIVERSSPDSDISPLRQALAQMGDSLVAVDDDDIIKVHLHTDNPGDALQAGLGYGMLSKIKIENMREQVERRVKQKRQRQAQAPAPEAAPGPGAPVYAYRPVDEEIDYGFVAVGAGEGVIQLFADLGVDNMVTGGQTMNPSTDDILGAIQATPAGTVFVLPNNKNIIMAAEQAARLADRRVDVLPTTSLPQGLSAMLAFDPDGSVDDNHIAMMRAAEHVGTGQITYAARDSDFDGKKIKEGELLALENGKLAFTAKDLTKAVIRLTKSMLRTGGDHSFITLISGAEVDEETANAVEAALREKLPDDIELAHIRGGQPVYYFILSVD